LVPLQNRLEVLRSNVTADEPELVCHSVMRRLIDADTEDDVALVAIRRTA
jgi:hypothetical protein